MQRREFLRGAALPVLAAAAGRPKRAAAQSQSPAAIALPKPQLQGGRPLMEALTLRKTNRNISEEKLSPQMLSNLLWAAWGVNRPDTGGRTAPSAMNVQEINLYVFLPEGVYLFDGPSHSLRPVLAGDHRAATGTQPDAGKAPLSLVYVADFDKYTTGRGGRGVTDADLQTAWSNAHAGFIGQNVYLFAASEGLASCFRAMLDSPALSKLLGLRASQKVLYGQSIGYPAKA
ncbi:MAG TPA: SagB/ThcOx family dehydrogenase [Bryobacteraceae bacterium]|nr:SagB/ThcOx family dehydrogenase [Bryobacteraceae bacterium]